MFQIKTKNTKPPQLIVVLSLVFLPFLVTFLERVVLASLISLFPLPTTSTYLLKMMVVSALLLALSGLGGDSYGLEIPKDKKLAKIVSFLLVLLIGASCLFLLSLQVKGFFDSLAVVHLVNWILTVFREEFVLRGIIQAQASRHFTGKILGFSLAIWISSVAFSLWHLVNLPYWSWHVVALQMIACFPAGIVLGLIKEKTGNTLLTFLLHICGDLLFSSMYTFIFGSLFLSLW